MKRAHRTIHGLRNSTRSTGLHVAHDNTTMSNELLVPTYKHSHERACSQLYHSVAKTLLLVVGISERIVRQSAQVARN